MAFRRRSFRRPFRRRMRRETQWVTTAFAETMPAATTITLYELLSPDDYSFDANVRQDVTRLRRSLGTLRVGAPINTDIAAGTQALQWGAAIFILEQEFASNVDLEPEDYDPVDPAIIQNRNVLWTTGLRTTIYNLFNNDNMAAGSVRGVSDWPPFVEWDITPLQKCETDVGVYLSVYVNQLVTDTELGFPSTHVWSRLLMAD